MDERLLRTFMAVTKLHSFSRAAESLHLSQPTVSQHIRTLEQMLGGTLFDRTPREVRLTTAGRALYAKAGGALHQLEELRRAVTRAAGRIAGPLRVAASLTVGQYVLPPSIAVFQEAHPAVQLRLAIQNTEAIGRLALDGAIDLGLIEGPLSLSELHCEPFADDELVVIAAPGHPSKEKPLLDLRDLQGERFVLREAGSGTRRVMEERLASEGFAIDPAHVVAELASTEALKEVVASGVGVSVISQSAVRKEVQLGTLLVRRLKEVTFSRRLSFVWNPHQTRLPAAQALADTVKTEADV